jgi:hypothetical protein
MQEAHPVKASGMQEAHPVKASGMQEAHPATASGMQKTHPATTSGMPDRVGVNAMRTYGARGFFQEKLEDPPSKTEGGASRSQQV